MGIPKIVHLTYKSIEEIPERWKDVLPAWKKTHPDWEIRFWTDADNDKLISEKFSWFKETYDNFPYKIQKIDAVRICYLYEFGGVYIDMDYIPKKNISALFENADNDLYFTTSSNVKCFTNSFMASKPQIEFWMDYLRSMVEEQVPWYYTKHFVIMNTTGPLKLDKLLKKYNGIIGYIPPELIHPCSVCNKFCKQDERVYFQTLVGFSWNSFDSQFLNFVYCNYRKILLVVLIIILLIILYIRKRLSDCSQCNL